MNNKTQITAEKAKLNKQFIFGIAGFTVLFQLSIFLNKYLDPSLIGKIILALIPVIPFIIALLGFKKLLQHDDEMHQKITIDSLVLTLSITLTWTLAAGLLQQLDVLPNFSLYGVFFITLITFSFCYLFINKKYK